MADGQVVFSASLEASNIEKQLEKIKTSIAKWSSQIGDSLSLFVNLDSGNSSSEMSKLSKETKKAQESAAKASNDTEGLNESVKKLGDKAKKTSSDVEGLSNKVKQAGQAAKESENGMQSLSDTISKWGKAIVASKALAVVGEKLFEFAKAGIEYNAQMETYQTNFSVMLGDQAKAIEHVTSLKEMAAKTPFGMAELASASQTLLSFGANADTVMGNLQMLGDIALGDKEKLSSLSLAFAQVSSAGKLTGQDLLQMVNAGFNPLNTIAERTGTNLGDLKEVMGGGAGSKEFRKAMKAAQDEVKKLGSQASEGAKLLAQIGAEGMISAEMVGKAMQMETSPGGRFYKGMEQASQTMEGLWSTLQDDTMELVGNTMEGLSNVLTSKVLPAAINVVGAINGVFENLESAKISVETQEAIDTVNALDTQIADIKNKYVTDSIKVKVEYTQSLDLIKELEDIQKRLDGTPRRLWSEQDVTDLQNLTNQLVALNPELNKFVGKDGVIEKEAAAVRELVEEYKLLALQKAAQSAMETAWQTYFETEAAAENLRTRRKMLQEEQRAAVETGNAWKELAFQSSEAYVALTQRTVDSLSGFGMDGVAIMTDYVESAKAAVQSFMDLGGDLSLLTNAGIDLSTFYDGFTMRSAEDIMANADAMSNLGTAMLTIGEAAITQEDAQKGLVTQLTTELDAAAVAITTAEATSAEALASAESWQATIEGIASGTTSMGEMVATANAAIDGVATKAAEATAEPYTVELEPDDQASGTIDKVEQELSNLNGKGATVYINVETTGGVPTDVSDVLANIPKYKDGLEYVPYDNYLALLHKGERVLTAAEADALRTLNGRDVASELANRTFGTSGSGLIGSSNTIVNQTVNFNTPVETPDEVAQTMKMYATYGLTGA